MAHGVRARGSLRALNAHAAVCEGLVANPNIQVITFVIVTHNEELANMADRKLIMVDGMISN